MAAGFRVAFVGTGGISRTHAKYYVHHPRTEIVAACDIDPEKLRGFQEQFNVPAGYADYHELLTAQQPDLVSVCTWHGTHAEISIAAAQAGARAILTEKPMGRDLAEAQAMVAAAEATGCKLAVHYQYRFLPAFMAAREALLAGLIGEPVTMFWRTGGGMLNNGCHGLDLFRWLLGDPDWTAVFGQVERTSNRYERGLPAEDRTLGLIRFEGGHELVLEVDMLDDEQADNTYRLHGPAGLIECDRRQARVLVAGERDWCQLPLPPYISPVEELISWVEGGPPHRNAGPIALVGEEIMMAIYESARCRQLLKPPFQRLDSPLQAMVDEGALAVDEPAYDIRSEAALQYEMQRTGN